MTLEYPNRFLLDFEVAAMLGISAAQIRQWAARGEIPSTRLPDGRAVFPRDMVDAWLLERTRPATGAHGILIQ